MNNKVSITRCEDVWSFEQIMQATKDVIAPLGGIETFVKKGDKVVIKPNLILAIDKATGVVTHPLLVKAIIMLAQEAQAGKIVVLENVGIGREADEILSACEVTKLAKELGVEVRPSAKKCRKVPLKWHHNYTELDICEECLDADCLINVPVMKTHLNTTVSLSQKNLKGCLPHRSMRKMHMGGVDNGLVGLADAIRPKLNIVDGLIGSDGIGPIYGDPVESKVLLASSDTFALDVVCCEIMGFDPREVRHIAHGATVLERSLDYKDVELYGPSVEEVRCIYKPSPSGYDNVYGSDIVEQDACTGCNSTLVGVLTEVNGMGKTDIFDDYTFVIGQSVQVPERHGNRKLLCIGNCLKKQKDKADLYIDGCPPISWNIIAQMFKESGRESEVDWHAGRTDRYHSLPDEE